MIDENLNVYIQYEIEYQIKTYRTPKLTFKCYFQSYPRNPLNDNDNDNDNDVLFVRAYIGTYKS